MRLLHTMLRVGNLEKSLDFSPNVLGMKLFRLHAGFCRLWQRS